VNDDLGAIDGALDRIFQAIANDVGFSDAHGRGNDQMEVNKDNPTCNPRSQIMNLCELQKASKEGHSFEYEAGSIETLRRMVELSDGITILPELASMELTGKQQEQLRQFKRPAPMREVSLVVHRDFVKKRLVEILKKEIIAAVPEKIRKNKALHVLPI